MVLPFGLPSSLSKENLVAVSVSGANRQHIQRIQQKLVEFAISLNKRVSERALSNIVLSFLEESYLLSLRKNKHGVYKWPSLPSMNDENKNKDKGDKDKGNDDKDKGNDDKDKGNDNKKNYSSLAEMCGLLRLAVPNGSNVLLIQTLKFTATFEKNYLFGEKNYNCLELARLSIRNSTCKYEGKVENGEWNVYLLNEGLYEQEYSIDKHEDSLFYSVHNQDGTIKYFQIFYKPTTFLKFEFLYNFDQAPNYVFQYINNIHFKKIWVRQDICITKQPIWNRINFYYNSPFTKTILNTLIHFIRS
jgi:hypothetical protein